MGESPKERRHLCGNGVLAPASQSAQGKGGVLVVTYRLREVMG